MEILNKYKEQPTLKRNKNIINIPSISWMLIDDRSSRRLEASLSLREKGEHCQSKTTH